MRFQNIHLDKEMKIRQSRSFARRVKKLSNQDKKILDRHIHKILETPDIGKEKKGNLKGVYVYKFKIKTIQYLLSYRFVDNYIELVMIGPHENYYRDLTDYLKERK